MIQIIQLIIMTAGIIVLFIIAFLFLASFGNME